MEITSRENRIIKDYRRLVADAKYRRESGRFVVEGARLCADAARSGVVVETAVVTSRATEQYAAAVEQVQRVAATVYTITETVAETMRDTDTPQGVFAVCRLPEVVAEPTPKGRWAALERIQDPGNLGTMIRTAEAFGLSGVLLSDGCCDVFSPKVVRASMGGVFRLPIVRVGSLAETLPLLGKRGFHSFACVVSDGVSVQDATFPEGSICVIGNEGNGLLPETAQACDRRITIPMAGRAESLNASMAAGIVFWEMVRI